MWAYLYRTDAPRVMVTEESLDHEELEERIISRRKLLALTAGVGAAGIVGLTPDDAEAARGRRSLKLVETQDRKSVV